MSDSGQYLQLQWAESWSRVNIAAKEMVPIVIATAIWGYEWQRHTVPARSDNMAVIQARGSATHPLLMHLIRCLHFFATKHDVTIRATHGTRQTEHRGGYLILQQALSNPRTIHRHACQALPAPWRTGEGNLRFFIDNLLAPATLQS